MRIIAGTAGRRRIKVPKAVARPTTDRTREALFSMLANAVVDAQVLDLFAGSGSLGLEALSRGAESATFVDADRNSHKTIKDNLADLGFRNARVTCSDVFAFLRRAQPSSYGLIFADPPYLKHGGDDDYLSQLLQFEQLHTLLKPDGFLILEAPSSYDLDLPETLHLVDHRTYGGCQIFFIQTL